MLLLTISVLRKSAPPSPLSDQWGWRGIGGSYCQKANPELFPSLLSGPAASAERISLSLQNGRTTLIV